MDNSNRQMSRSTDNLGVNKLGKNIIKKSPIHQPNFANSSVRPPQQPQPHVYTIDKNDFRNVVQQLTGSPSHHQEQQQQAHPPHPRMHQNNPPKPPSMRLQKIRPPPLMPINRPYVRVQAPPPPAQQNPNPNPPMVVLYNNNNHNRPPQQYAQLSPPIRPPFPPPGDAWPNTAESPVSAYMRYLQNFITDPTSRPITPQAQPYTQQPPYGLVQNQPHQLAPGLLPNPSMPPQPSPRFHGIPSPRMNGPPPPLPSPRMMNGPPPPLPSPRMYGGGPPPQMNGPPLLPSPTSQFLLPSPTGFMVSPRSSSSYPWFSPGFQHPPPLTPNFSFSPMAHQSGILGPGPGGPQPPPSPNYLFPLSPNGLFPIVSPRWRHQ